MFMYISLRFHTCGPITVTLFAAATARRWSFLHQLLATLLCIALPFLCFCCGTLFANTVLLPGNIPALTGHFLFSCFVSMKWKQWKSSFALVFHFRLRAWQFYFFFVLEYCTADQNTVISLFLDDRSKGSIKWYKARSVGNLLNQSYLMVSKGPQWNQCCIMFTFFR